MTKGTEELAGPWKATGRAVEGPLGWTRSLLINHFVLHYLIPKDTFQKQ